MWLTAVVKAPAITHPPVATAATRLAAVALAAAVVAVVSTIPDDEYAVLQGLYNYYNGKAWTRADGWLQYRDSCTWYGVTCDPTQTHVV